MKLTVAETLLLAVRRLIETDLNDMQRAEVAFHQAHAQRILDNAKHRQPADPAPMLAMLNVSLQALVEAQHAPCEVMQ